MKVVVALFCLLAAAQASRPIMRAVKERFLQVQDADVSWPDGSTSRLATADPLSKLTQIATQKNFRNPKFYVNGQLLASMGSGTIGSIEAKLHGKPIKVGADGFSEPVNIGLKGRHSCGSPCTQVSLSATSRASDGSVFPCTVEGYCVQKLLGGVNGAKLILDESSSPIKKLVFKPGVGPKPHLTKAEIAASYIANKINGGLTPVLTAKTLTSSTGATVAGTVQDFIEQNELPMEGKVVKIADLTEAQRAQLFASLIADYAVSNWDCHHEQFAIAKTGGKLLAMDKGQGFKFFESNDGQIKGPRWHLPVGLCDGTEHNIGADKTDTQKKVRPDQTMPEPHMISGQCYNYPSTFGSPYLDLFKYIAAEASQPNRKKITEAQIVKDAVACTKSTACWDANNNQANVKAMGAAEKIGTGAGQQMWTALGARMLAVEALATKTITCCNDVSKTSVAAIHTCITT